MALQDIGPGLGCAVTIGVAAMLARRHCSRLPQVMAVDRASADAGRLIDVVVPARNEAARIGQCVAALRGDPSISTLTVVDDGSEDGTAERARAAGAQVISLLGPPPGWLGKPHACHAGAHASEAEWLAFVDADVLLAPGALPALILNCLRTGVAATSPLLRQQCSSPGDRLLIPLAYWQYMVGLPGAAARRTRVGTRAILNGQCIVVRRSAYRAAGGHAHAGVRRSVVDDSALARRLVDSGHRVSLVRGETLGTVRMYNGLAAVRAGLGKNIAGFLAADPFRGVLVALAGMATSSAPWLLRRAWCRRTPAAALGAAAAYAAGSVALSSSYRDAGEPGRLCLAHPLASLAMQAIALESVVRTLVRRRLPWRGRPVD
ncbi:MAG: glycosyltransferase family 2 protein [Candidatus Dormibacteria bacterium]